MSEEERNRRAIKEKIKQEYYFALEEEGKSIFPVLFYELA